MVDTERFHINPDCARFVFEVAASLARRGGDNTTQVLEVATYLPLDVDTVGRAMESLDEDPGVERIQEEEISFYRFDDPDQYSLREFDLDAGEHLSDIDAGLTRTMNALKSEDDWAKKLREQHEILHIAAGARSRTIELSYFTSRSDIPSARVQSILNDFGAEGYVEIDYDEDTDTLSYTFPDLEYPSERFERNTRLVEHAEPTESSSPVWLVLLVSTIILLVVVLLIRSTI
jgi:hypothetical protein